MMKKCSLQLAQVHRLFSKAWSMLVVATVIAGGLASTGQGEESERPNIIFILADDMGWDIAALGHPHVKTPHLDRLVAEGRTFDQFYVASPVCSPTRVSFMTGYQPSRFEIHEFIRTDVRANWRRGIPNFLDPGVVTVTDVARRAGYRTGHYGKWHLGTKGPRPSEYGIDESRIGWTISQYYWSYSAHKHVDEALRFLQRNGNRPFYLNLWFFQMHAPIVARTEQKAVYEGESFPASDFESHMADYAALMTDGEERFLEYNAVMTSVDAAIGKLLDYLDTAGLAENTLILFTSDNGPEDFRVGSPSTPGAGSTSRYRGRKRSLYEGGVRMPCIARWPGVIPAGTADTSSVLSSGDWLPTVATLLDQEIPPFMEGENKLEVLKGTPADRARPLFYDYRNRAVGEGNAAPQYAIRKGRWKFLWEEGLAEPELYDILADPEERYNVAAEEVDTVGALFQELSEFRQELELSRPVIRVQPVAEASPYVGESVSFRVEASGTPPPGYRWLRNGQQIYDGPKVRGAQTHLLELFDLTLADTATYSCLAVNKVGQTYTTGALLKVQLAPSIVQEPGPQYVWEGGLARYSVKVNGSEPFTYQWSLNGIPLQEGDGVQGSQSSELTVAGLQAPLLYLRAEGYDCRVENLAGEAVSRRASLIVTPTVADFDSWMEFHTNGESSEGSYTANSDSDSWTDFMEFAGVSDPTQRHEYPHFAVSKEGDLLVVSYDRWRGGAEAGFGSYETPVLRYDLEVLEDEEWVPMVEQLSLGRAEPNLTSTGERAIYHSLLPVTRKNLVLRLKVTER